MKQFAQPIKKAATVKEQLDQDAGLSLLGGERFIYAETAAQPLPNISSVELEENTPLKKSHRYPMFKSSNQKGSIYFQGNAVINTNTGEIFAPYTRKKK